VSNPDNKAAPPVDPGAFQIEVNEIPGPDFTTYLPKQEFEKELVNHQPDRKGDTKRSHALSFSIRTKADKHAPPLHGRGLACSAYGDNFWSITLRCDTQNIGELDADYRSRVAKVLAKYAEVNPSVKGKVRDYLGYWPDGDEPYLEAFKNEGGAAALGPEHTDEARSSSLSAVRPDKETFLNEVFGLCNILYKILFPTNSSHPSGLIAVTGATDSSKSLITRGLIFLFLRAAAKEALKTRKRKPHLITFEDPIEQYYIKSPHTHIAPALNDLKEFLQALYLDYTPREKDSDATTLREVLKNALRQTPAVLFVGETREEQDWKDLLEFAGSGHLVITTSHAGSVVEAMSGIFRDTKTETAAQRSEISRRILGIINIRSDSFQSIPKQVDTAQSANGTEGILQVRALLPAVWKRTSQSMNNLIADGLASLVPQLSLPNIGYYSRTYFAHELTKTKMLTPDLKLRQIEVQKELVRKARKWDLEGG
jgi:Tfp pilus assembly pilus retraction ATPase PilT